ncbi:MAG: hypothetical protein GYB66_10120 [Chloroflexi bacterium]|nr:hypothetical protein [Chloroflexota bacterium]
MIRRILSALVLIAIILTAGCGNDNDSDDSVSDPTPPPATETPELPQESSEADGSLVAEVNGQPITRAQLNAEIDAQALTSQAADPLAFEYQILDDMIDQVLIEQFVLENDLASEADVQAEIEALQEEAASRDVTLETITGYPPEMTDQKIREAVYTRAMVEHISSQVSDTSVQVHARHILVKNEEAARDVLSQLDAGASFEELARQFSKDGSTAEAGGDLGWVARGDLLQQEVEDVIFQMEPQSRWQEPVSSALGYHVVEVLEVEERPLDEQQLLQQQQHAFREWLEEQRTQATITRYIGPEAVSSPVSDE